MEEVLRPVSIREGVLSMSLKISCLSCGHKICLDEVYSDYDGPVNCYACGATLAISLSESSIKSVIVVKPAPTGKGGRGHQDSCALHECYE